MIPQLLVPQSDPEMLSPSPSTTKRAPLNMIQEILGHSRLSTTADIYGYLFPQAFAEAADALDRAVR
jgi:hypothetical protein